MQSQDSVETEEWSLDCLPFDCIVCVCEFLTPEDLSRFARVCKVFQEASQIGYLWRRHCLSRWVFCDVHQIQEGPQRWRRYFLARRKVEARLDTGRPGRDYKVKTLRGHDKEIVDAVVIGGSQVNWENPKPPLVVSMSTDGSVKGWDVLQAKAVWSLDGGEKVVSIAGDSATLELAVGKSDGSITIWDTQTWSVKATLQSGTDKTIATLKYVTVKMAKSAQTYLLAHTEGFDVMAGQSGQLEVWDPMAAAVDVTTTTCTGEAAVPVTPTTAATKPLYVLWAPAHSAQLMQISSAHLLALPGRIGDVHVWDFTNLSSIKGPPPLPPNVTINTQEAVNSIAWAGPGILATTSSWRSIVDLWDVTAHIEKLQKSSRSIYDDTNMHNPLRTIACDVPIVLMSVANGLIIAGDSSGNVSVLDPSEKAAGASPGGCLQRFSDHKGSVMDIYADSFRVLTCSKDFSIRVYRWTDRRSQLQQSKAATAVPPAQLESKYTLLGGSVAHKTHDGFKRLLCESGSCVGIAGNQLKFYTFYSKLDNA